MNNEPNYKSALKATWRLNQRVGVYLIENIPKEVWEMKVPGYKQKTVRMIGGHLHNTRCMWIKKIGNRLELKAPGHVDRYNVSQPDLIRALEISSEVILNLLEQGMEHGGKLPGFSLDTLHFLNYLASHEAHHRGQIIMVCRQLGHRLPDEVAYGVWKWSKRAKEI